MSTALTLTPRGDHIDARQLAEPQALLNTLKVFSTGSTPDGEPTWEDAAWQ